MAETAETEVPLLTSDPPELETLELEVDGQVGTLTLNRPDALNAMSPELIGELTTAAAWLADRAPIRALIITGAGRAFCSGGDVNWFKRGVTDETVDLPSEVRRGAEALHNAIVDIRRIPYPVIAAINGPAAGAGMSLALSADIRIASEDAFLAIAYGRIGAAPDGGMTYFLPRVVGPAKALELALNDPNLDAKAALEAGLVTEVVPADQLLERSQGEGREAGRQGAVLRPHDQAPPARVDRALDQRSPAARAARDRGLHGHERPASRRHGLLCGRHADVRGRLTPIQTFSRPVIEWANLATRERVFG